jgi:hypothetical protein
MLRLLLWLLLSFRFLVADDSNFDSGDSDSGGSDSGDSGGSDSGGSDSGGSGSGDAGTESSLLSASGDDSDSGSGRRRRLPRNAMLVRQDGTPDPTNLSPDDYRDGCSSSLW